MPKNSIRAATVVCKPRGTIEPHSPPSHCNTLLSPHVSLYPHSLCGALTDIHLKHFAANYSSAGSHLNIDDTGTKEDSRQPTPIKRCCVMSPPYPLPQGTQRFTHSAKSDAVDGLIQDQQPVRNAAQPLLRPFDLLFFLGRFLCGAAALALHCAAAAACAAAASTAAASAAAASVGVRTA
jgi:hypothetical protein